MRYTHFVVSFDEEKKLFSFSFIDSNEPDIGPSEQQSFKVIDVGLEDLMAAGPEKAKEFVGNAVLSTMHRLRDIDSSLLDESDLDFKEAMEHVNALIRDRKDKDNLDE